MRCGAADRRHAYYSVDLARFGELLALMGVSLHPGLGPVTVARDGGGEASPAAVLFVCTGNSARSQLAEALLGQMAGGAAHAWGAGSSPKPLQPNAVRVMGERGLDLSSRRSKHLSEFADRRFDYVITLCDGVREVCPEFPGDPRAIHWSIADSGVDGGSDEETYPASARTADELETRLGFFLHVLRLRPPDPEKQLTVTTHKPSCASAVVRALAVDPGGAERGAAG
jgi:protein-tyrosine-phosphatase